MMYLSHLPFNPLLSLSLNVTPDHNVYVATFNPLLSLRNIANEEAFNQLLPFNPLLSLRTQ